MFYQSVYILQSDDGDLVMYSTVAFKSNVRTVKDFREFFQVCSFLRRKVN